MRPGSCTGSASCRRAAALVVVACLVATVPGSRGEATAAGGEALRPVGEEVHRKSWSWTWIDGKGLALGGGGLERDDVEDLRARGFGAVLNYRGEFPQEEEWVREAGMDYLLLENTFAEEDTMPLEHVEAAVAFIEENLAVGRPVYVHCIGGWHRSPVGPVAYYMKTRGWRFEQAFEHVASLRQGVDPRYSEPLLAYEAHLFDEPGLTLDLWTQRWNVAPNETIRITALVTRNGAPVEGAAVTFVPESGGATTRATSGPDGRAGSTFTAGPAPGVQYVHARAAKAGFVDGYDRNVYWVGTAKMRAPTVLEPLPGRIDAEPGEAVVVPIRVREADGSAANARVTLTTACSRLYRDYTGWDGTENATFRAPAKPGAYEVLAHVNRFPAPPVFETFELVVGGGGPEPACVEAPSRPPDAASVPTPGGKARVEPVEDAEGVSGSKAWILPALAGGVAVAALVLPWRRTRR